MEMWDLLPGRRQVGSPDARRSGRKSSGLSVERCPSRSRSPGDCERIARGETRLLPEVIWDYHICMLDPDVELIVNQAKAASTVVQGRRFSMLESRATSCGDGWEGMP